MTGGISPADVAELVEHLYGRKTDQALQLALRLADDGVPTARILTDLIGPAQVEVGERWYRNEYSVADEHAATHVADTLVTLLGAHEGRTIPTGQNVVALCPEGEWHSLPLRVTAQVLELDELEVSYLGASVPAEHLDRFLRRSRPDAVVLSCSTPLAFVGVLATVEVAHRWAVPVIAGGRAFGSDAHRAEVLGVDRWATSALAAAGLVRDGVDAPLRSPSASASVAEELALDRPRLVDEAFEALRRRFPPMSDYSVAQLQQTRQDLVYIAEFAEASILVQDARIFDEFLAWLGPLLESRGVPEAALDVGLAAMADVADGPRAALLANRP